MDLTSTRTALARADDSRWFRAWRRGPISRARLFCLHHAGGSASLFRNWHEQLPADLEVVAIALPGREQRIDERRFTRMEPLVADLSRVIRPLLDLPYALFGYSMGATIGFELLRSIERGGLPGAALFIAAGRQAPQCPPRAGALHTLDDSGFCEEFLRKNYSPQLQQLLANDELRAFFTPQLRADMELIETYTYRESVPLRCPIVACGGREDPDVHESDVEAWAAHTRGAFRPHFFSGEHAFVRSAGADLVAMLRRELCQVIEGLD
jgi:surfactin synthase thioesterase subunit